MNSHSRYRYRCGSRGVRAPERGAQGVRFPGEGSAFDVRWKVAPQDGAAVRRGGAGTDWRERESRADFADLVADAVEPLPPISEDGFAAFADRFAEARIILLGKSSHGTDEFYRARAAITERLVRQHGFDIIAVEADWPDAARIDGYIRGHADLPPPLTPFQRFPMWMWRNRPVREMVDRLHAINASIEDSERKVGFYGIDLYSLPSSMDAVEDFVRRNSPEALEEVRRRYGCLAPWLEEPSRYGALAHRKIVDTCAEEVQSVIDEVLGARMSAIRTSDRAVFDALQNARIVAASEAYYRAMYEGSVASWNLRDRHMFETLEAVLQARGPGPRPWSGRTTRISATPRRPRWGAGARSTSANSAANGSARRRC